MTLVRAVLRRDWILHGRRIVDLAILLALAVTVFPGDSPAGFGAMGAVIAASLGARLGGDENLGQSLEFLWTRPVDRRAWFRMRFTTGLAAIAVVLVVVVLADAVDLHLRFASLFADVLESDPRLPFEPIAYAFPLGFALLVHAFAFSIAARERRPEHVLDARVAAVVFAAVIATATALVVHLALDRLGRFDGRMFGLLSTQPSQQLIPATIAIVVAASIALVARRRFASGEIVGGDATASGASHGWWLVILLASTLIALALFWGVQVEAPR